MALSKNGARNNDSVKKTVSAKIVLGTNDDQKNWRSAKMVLCKMDLSKNGSQQKWISPPLVGEGRQIGRRLVVNTIGSDNRTRATSLN